MPRNTFEAKQMIVMRRDLKMRKGKIAAQAGHACVSATLQALVAHKLIDRVSVMSGHLELLSNDQYSPLVQWFEKGEAKVCVYVDSKEELLKIAEEGHKEGFIVALIRDAGITEFHGKPTLTCLAFEPLFAKQIDPITGDLPLY